ncbi:helix-turn-helix transcriptional regulator [Pseudohoeflea coraliihabitans]|uniref:AraC family transcriptional regulator n=1 Tax=Pseudohoeflea coraliihabitans TaxID=2860393 RepID=A0ABS6WL37_9HYPH|nr:AraC family transcriptional regulator [Pseudohoeflea sp. DP4N28-3]MBW3096664.1 AraC family transcriptional regulator [Pseudohoeflea sp. DP4N28-3]
MSDALRIKNGPFGRVALLDMDRSLVRHAHPHCHVLLKIDGADTSFLVGDSVAHLTDESAVLINAWTPHAYVHRPDAPRTIILALYIEPSWLTMLRHNWAASGGAGFFGRISDAITPRIRKQALELASSMVHAPTAEVDHEEQLSALMIAVIERFTEWRTVGDHLRNAARTQCIDRRVSTAIAEMRSNPGSIDGIDRLAASSGMSRANFFRVFENSTGVTPRVFLNAIRLEQAISATLSTDVSFGALSDRLGFSTQAHFTRFFRDNAGVTPSNFRATSRLGDLSQFLRI